MESPWGWMGRGVGGVHTNDQCITQLEHAPGTNTLGPGQTASIYRLYMIMDLLDVKCTDY